VYLRASRAGRPRYRWQQADYRTIFRSGGASDDRAKQLSFR
jgi:hypothetical protein